MHNRFSFSKTVDKSTAKGLYYHCDFALSEGKHGFFYFLSYG